MESKTLNPGNIVEEFFFHSGQYPVTQTSASIFSKNIEKHIGVIWTESELNKDSNFNLLLPKTQD